MIQLARFLKSLFSTAPVQQDRTSPRKNFQQLSDTCRGLQFVSVAHTPTVTLPRLKAMMMGELSFKRQSSLPTFFVLALAHTSATGYHPSFMDIIRNFDAGAESGDNILLQVNDAIHRLHNCTYCMVSPQVNRSGGSITYFGDDTWGKVFPPVFSRVDGVTSFDVLDTHAVDLNVTRNTIRELRHAHDWRLSIWHFLGVDHAGHVGGIHSETMCVPLFLHFILR